MHKSKINNITCDCIGIKSLVHPYAKLVLTDNGQNLVVEQNGIISVYQLIDNETSIQGKLLWERRSKEPIFAIVPLDSNRMAVLRSDANQADLSIVSKSFSQHLNSISREPSSMTYVNNELVIAVKKNRDNEAALIGIDITTGHRTWSLPLEDDDVEVVPDADVGSLIINERRKKKIRRVSKSKCCNEGKSGDNDSKNPDNCYDGFSLLPFDCYDLLTRKNTIIKRHNRRCEPQSDCSAHLDWYIWDLKKAGNYAVAWSRGHRSMAIVDPNDMQIMHQQYFGDSPVVAAYARNSPRLIYFDFFTGTWNSINLNNLKSAISIQTNDHKENSSFTFIGQEEYKHSNMPSTGDVNVLIVPVIEPGQLFEDSDLEKFSNYIKTNFFNEIKDFYEELSYDKLHLNFRVLGYDEPTYTKNPVQLPQSIKSYWNQPYEPGGLKATVGSLPSTYNIKLDGTESLIIDVTTRDAKKTEQLIIPFYALGLAKKIDSIADAMLNFIGNETAVLDIVNTHGNTKSLNLVFPPKTISLTSEEEIDINNYLEQISNYLSGILETAEGVAAGMGLFEKVKVLRVTQEDLVFGTLEINLSFKPIGPEKGFVNISTQFGLEKIGFDVASKPLYGKLTLPTDQDALKDYITRSLRQGQEDFEFIQGNRILNDKVGVDFSGGKLEIFITLSDEDGGQGAFISVASQSRLEILGFDNIKSITGVSNVVDGRAPKNRQKLINDVFTGALIRLGALYTSSNNTLLWSDFKAKTFDNYGAVVIAIVGQAPSNEWNAADPEGIRNASGGDNWRMFTTHATARYTGQLPSYHIIPPQTDTPFTSALIDKFVTGFVAGIPDNRSITTCHELGHALGFSDMYGGRGFRDDLLYLGKWDIMGNSNYDSHFCGYHKWAAEWISDTEVTEVGKPDQSTSIDMEVLLVPLEYWDDDIVNAVRSVYSDVDSKKVKVSQLILIKLGGDGVQFDLVEARQRGIKFSNSLPAQPALLVTNNIIRSDDTRYTVIYGKFNPKKKLDPDKIDLDNQTTEYVLRYRRRIHPLNESNTLIATGNSFDLGKAAELAAKGVTVTIKDIKSVTRPCGQVQVFHVKVHREPADFVDIYLNKGDPAYASPDIWIDWTGDNNGDTNEEKQKPENMYVYPAGTPVNQGETVRYPPSGSTTNEFHWIGGRVWNGGNIEVRNVRVNTFLSIPPGSGDQNLSKDEYDDTIIPRIPPKDWRPFSIKWEVKPETNAHMCIRAEVTDWELPQNGTELGGDDLMLSNNWAQKNVFEFVPTPGSPYEEISFVYSVKNGGLERETAFVEPEGLPYGCTLTVSPHRRVIGPRETALFNCKLKLDEKIIDTGCHNDKSFMLVTWRETDHADERWGGCKYDIKPRKRTVTEIYGSWVESLLFIFGSVTPNPYTGLVQIRLAFEGVESFWVNVGVEEGGTFKLQMSPDKGIKLDSIAYYTGSTEFGPSTSNIIHVDKSIIK